jgi:hypothetical protein
MSERIKRLISSVIPELVSAVDRGAASEARLSITGDSGAAFPIWVTVQTIEAPENLVIRTVAGVRDTSLEVPESQLSPTRERKFWAHTNDFDGMVYGWAAAELYVVNSDKAAIIEAVLAHLDKKLEGQERITVRMLATAAAGQPSLPTMEGDSDSGPEGIHEQPEFNGF